MRLEFLVVGLVDESACWTMTFNLDIEAIQSPLFGMPHPSLMSLSLLDVTDLTGRSLHVYDSGEGGDTVPSPRNRRLPDLPRLRILSMFSLSKHDLNAKLLNFQPISLLFGCFVECSCRIVKGSNGFRSELTGMEALKTRQSPGTYHAMPD